MLAPLIALARIKLLLSFSLLHTRSSTRDGSKWVDVSEWFLHAKVAFRQTNYSSLGEISAHDIRQNNSKRLISF